MEPACRIPKQPPFHPPGQSWSAKTQPCVRGCGVWKSDCPPRPPQDSPQAAGSGPGQPCSGDEERRYRCIVDTADEGIWAIDSSHQTSFVNQKLAQMLGYEPGEMVGQPVDASCSPRTWTTTPNAWSSAARDRSSAISAGCGARMAAPCGPRSRPLPCWTPRGEFAGSFAMYTDITQARALEEDLARSRQRFKAMFENALDGILVYDDGARLMEANPAACRLTGYLPAELTGLMIWDLIPEESPGQQRHSWQLVHPTRAPERGDQSVDQGRPPGGSGVPGGGQHSARPAHVPAA